MFPLFAFVCGRLMGGSAELVDCERRQVNLLGSVWVPPASREDCDGGDAYTHREGFSICWLDLTRSVNRTGPRLAILRLPGVHRKDVVPSW